MTITCRILWTPVLTGATPARAPGLEPAETIADTAAALKAAANIPNPKPQIRRRPAHPLISQRYKEYLRTSPRPGARTANVPE